MAKKASIVLNFHKKMQELNTLTIFEKNVLICMTSLGWVKIIKLS